MAWVAVGSAAAGAVASSLLNGGGGGGGSTTSTVNKDPWSGSMPYLTGSGKTPKLDANGQPVLDAQGQPVMNEAIPGVMPNAATNYANGGWNAAMQTNNNNNWNNNNAAGAAAATNATNLGGKLAAGGYNANISAVGPASLSQITGAPQVSAQFADPNAGMTSLGLGGKPQAALSQVLSGTPNNPYLDSQAKAIEAMSNKNLAQNVMPGIRSGAEAAGQYGGSRQGIAEGLARGRSQRKRLEN